MQPLPALHPSDADFAAIRRDGDFYVDKTPLFRDLLAPKPGPGIRPLMHRHQFLARPRRFGKTLLINTLEAWFQGLPPGHEANSDRAGVPLDGMPTGWTNPPWLWRGLDAEDWHGVHGWHPVIRLDLSRAAADTPAGTEAALRVYLWRQVGTWGLRTGRWPVPNRFAPPPELPPQDLLTSLIESLTDAYGRKPVVLVDEYDAPITKHLGPDRDPRPVAEELHDFFRVLKDDANLLYGVFLTGITRFARDHLFSAANNIIDISDEPAYGTLCGFTEEEVDRHFAPYRARLAELDPRLAARDVRAAWRAFYNGYRFSQLPGAPRVYNPFTLTAGLDRVLAEPDRIREAADGAWPSAWSRSGHPGLIMRLANDPHQPRPMSVWFGAQLPPPIDGLGDLARPDPVRLMLDTGYYTWYGSRDGADLHIGFPNREVAESWLRDIFEAWTVPDNEAGDGNLVDSLRVCLARGDTDGFAGHLETFVFGQTHENLRSEAACNVLMQALFRLLADATQSEKSAWGGRSDHEVRVGERLYVFEVKYNRSADAALRQIRDRGYGREHLGNDRPVTAVGLAFRRDLKTGPGLQVAQADLAKLLADRAADADNGPRAVHTTGRTG